jgi:hypothetical protein
MMIVQTQLSAERRSRQISIAKGHRRSVASQQQRYRQQKKEATRHRDKYF